MKEIIKLNKRFILLSSIVVILTSITALITPLIIQTRNENNLSTKTFFYIFIAVAVSFLLQIIAQVYRENYAAKFNTNYLFSLVQKMVNMTYDSYVQLEPTYLISRINSAVDSLYLFFITSFPAVIKAFIMLVCSLILAWFISWKISLVMFFLIPLNYFGFKLINKELAIRMDRMQRSSAVATKDLVVTLSNIDSVKANMDTKVLNNLLSCKVEAMYSNLANTNKFAGTTSATIGFLNQAVQNFVYLWTSILIVKGEFQISNLIILSIVFPLFFNALSEINKINIDFRSLLTSNNFLKEKLIANIEKDGERIINKIKSIEFNNPSFDLNGNQYSFNIKATIVPGNVLYLSGPSGSGKSSLLKLLLKFRDSAGIKVNGYAINDIQNNSLRNKIAYLAQETTILSTSIEENIAYGKKLTNNQKAFLKSTKILDPILKNKEWSTVLVENGSNLSGGEKQRIAVARLLLMEADLYIMDEITSSIDQLSATAIFEAILAYNKNKIIIFTSHDKLNKKYANRVISIEREDENG
ncbi:ATP-binding cassette, subfamily B, MsbA [Amphibacillus marinus]|uniref:ATP-binding cassette, subfamily B, MsbA n=1 Tax=Amphibacillus marinus TaxID=872970 RepID=A0A1H8PMJ6_9BACI|nr:ABC transporter ATP-binding protein [Amphibacillus marinus]SEO43135.1 ATP-binding cassette, subfamily B, MsbA [Amphibacillus marinus]